MGKRLAGAGLEWTTGSSGLRPGLREETRYIRPPGLHARALVLAAASPFVATLIVVGVGLLRP